MKRHVPEISIALLLALSLTTACSSHNGSGPVDGKQAYIDARMKFSVSYPESWSPYLTYQPADDDTPDTVAWDLEAENDHDGSLGMAVLSAPHSGHPDSTGMMIVHLQDIYPNLTITDTSDDRLPAGDAERIDGYMPHQRFLAWVVKGPQRTYLLFFTSSPERFSDHLKLFRSIADSFRILD